ncbi:MAG: hypothetical protein OXF56_06010 [Rhodobacteraceae bacterium]|nr:hypothetical protein [Paracoccaceae bacterium]
MRQQPGYWTGGNAGIPEIGRSGFAGIRAIARVSALYNAQAIGFSARTTQTDFTESDAAGRFCRREPLPTDRR